MQKSTLDAFQIPSASLDTYKCSVCPQPIRDRNDLPDSLISSAEMSNGCVSKFASLVRKRDYFSQSQSLVKYHHFGVAPVNYSDSYLTSLSRIFICHTLRDYPFTDSITVNMIKNDNQLCTTRSERRLIGFR